MLSQWISTSRLTKSLAMTFIKYTNFLTISLPGLLQKSSAVSLLNLLNSKYGNSWVNRFFSERRPSEYNLLGYSATIIEKGLGYSLIECNPADIHHSLRFKEDTDKFREEVDSCLRHPKHFFLIQSSLNLNIRHITVRVRCCYGTISPTRRFHSTTPPLRYDAWSSELER